MKAGAFEGITRDGHGADAADAKSTRAVDSEAAGESSHQVPDSWTSQPPQQAQVTGHCSWEENTGSRCGVESFHGENCAESPAACNDVSTMSWRSLGKLQCQDPRAEADQTGSQSGSAITVGKPMGSANDSRGADDCRTTGGIRSSYRCGDLHRTCGFDRGHGGGRDFRK